MDKRRLPKKWKFDDRVYKIVWKKPRDTKEIIERGETLHGDCADPKSPSEDRIMRFDPNLDDIELLHTIIHEILHAQLFILDELKVTQMAEELTEFITRCGFKIEKPD